VLGVLDRFLHVLGKFAHAAMLPRKARPFGDRVRHFIYVGRHSINVSVFRDAPPGPFPAPRRMAEPMH